MRFWYKPERLWPRRFNHKGVSRSFIAEDSLFIDIMMNIGIIYYAARETGDRSFAMWRPGMR